MLTINLIVIVVCAKGLEGSRHFLTFEFGLERQKEPMTRLAVHPGHIVIVHGVHGSAHLIELLTRCEHALPAVDAVLASHHVAQLPLLVLLGPRVEGQHIWVVVLAAATNRVSELLKFLLDTDLIPRSVRMLILLIVLHGLNNKQ